MQMILQILCSPGYDWFLNAPVTNYKITASLLKLFHNKQNYKVLN